MFKCVGNLFLFGALITLGPCNKSERRFCAKKRKDILDVEKRERGGKRIRRGTVEERVH